MHAAPSHPAAETAQASDRCRTLKDGALVLQSPTATENKGSFVRTDQDKELIKTVNPVLSQRTQKAPEGMTR